MPQGLAGKTYTEIVKQGLKIGFRVYGRHFLAKIINNSGVNRLTLNPKTMRTLTALPHLILLLAVLNSNAQRQIVPPPLRTPGTLNAVPLQLTGNLPDVYLPGDSVRIPHVRTHILEFTSSVTDNNYLIEGLKQRGREEGVDGILLTDYRKLIPGTSMMLGSINGIGLKYLGRVDYLDTILKQKVITIFEPDGSKGKTMILNADWYGQIINPPAQEDLKFYADSMAVMDLHVLFNRTLDIYTYKDFGYSSVLKIISNNKLPAKIVHDIEGTGGIIDHFQSTFTPLVAEAKKLKLKIRPVYTGDMLTGAIVVKPNKEETALYYLHYKYDSRGRLTDERWEKLVNGKRTLWLEVENRFFDAGRDFIETPR